MLLEKTHPHFLTRLLVRLLAILLGVVGLVFFVIGMVQFALSDGFFITLLQALLLGLAGFLLLRLRSRGVRVFALLVVLSYVQIFLGEEGYFWPQFFFSSTLLLLLCLLGSCYFSLRRGEGYRPRLLPRFFVVALYIVLTGSGFAAYDDRAFCTDKTMLEFDLLRHPVHVSLFSPLAQWLSHLSCPFDGDLSFERDPLSQSSPGKTFL